MSAIPFTINHIVVVAFILAIASRDNVCCFGQSRCDQLMVTHEITCYWTDSVLYTQLHKKCRKSFHKANGYSYQKNFLTITEGRESKIWKMARVAS